MIRQHGGMSSDTHLNTNQIQKKNEQITSPQLNIRVICVIQYIPYDFRNTGNFVLW